MLYVLITTHGRPDVLENCLTSLHNSISQVEGLSQQTSIWIGNSGGLLNLSDTLALFQEVSVVPLAQDSFWATSNRTLWNLIKLQAASNDDVLLLNDDVRLTPTAIQTLLQGVRQYGFIAGQTCDSQGMRSYGGWLRKGAGWRPLQKGDTFQQAHASNGNIVMSRFEQLSWVGGFPSQFKHRRADFYLSTKVRRLTGKLYIAPGFLGECDGWVDSIDVSNLRWGELYSLITSPKFHPVIEHFRYSVYVHPLAWPLVFIAPYFRAILSKFLKSKEADLY